MPVLQAAPGQGLIPDVGWERLQCCLSPLQEHVEGQKDLEAEAESCFWKWFYLQKPSLYVINAALARML